MKIVKILLLLLTACLLPVTAAAQESKTAALKTLGPVYEQKAVNDIFAFVQSAANEVSKRGEAAFVDFNKKGSKWYHGDRYLIAYDMNMVRVLYATHPEKVGEHALPITDPDGRPFSAWINEIAAGPVGANGWVHYRWEQPGKANPQWKSLFVVKVAAPSGKQYVIGSGVYNIRPEKSFIISLVDEAVALIEKDGERAFPLFRDRKGRFLYQDAYVFVYDLKGNCLVHPTIPSYEGTNRFNNRDVRGNYDVRDIVNTAQKDGGWLEYWTLRPGGGKKEQHKISYVKQAKYGDKLYAVGAGIYK